MIHYQKKMPCSGHLNPWFKSPSFMLKTLVFHGLSCIPLLSHHYPTIIAPLYHHIWNIKVGHVEAPSPVLEAQEAQATEPQDLRHGLTAMSDEQLEIQGISAGNAWGKGDYRWKYPKKYSKYIGINIPIWISSGILNVSIFP